MPDHNAEKGKVKKLLTETIRLLCKSSVFYNCQLNIEGLLGITIDNGEVYLVNINEEISSSDLARPSEKPKSGETNSIRLDSQFPELASNLSRKRSRGSDETGKWSDKEEEEEEEEASRAKAAAISDEPSIHDDSQLKLPNDGHEVFSISLGDRMSGDPVKNENQPCIELDNDCQIVVKTEPKDTEYENIMQNYASDQTVNYDSEACFYSGEGSVNDSGIHASQVLKDIAQLAAGDETAATEIPAVYNLKRTMSGTENNFNSHFLPYPAKSPTSDSSTGRTSCGEWFVCKVCGKVIGVKQWTRHSRLHTEVFKCTMCGRGFNRKDNLRRHYFLTHKICGKDVSV